LRDWSIVSVPDDSVPAGLPATEILADLPLRDYRPVSRARPRRTEVPRSAVACVDVHNHLGRWLTDGAWMVEDVDALLAVMDRCNVATVVNLDGRWGAQLAANIERYDAAHPGRFVTFCHLDWSLLAEPDGPAALVAGLRASHAAGARGIKVWKDLGLSWRDADGRLVLPDDPRIAAVFDEAGALDLPVLIHTADPVAFFDPLDATNERLEELIGQPDWWFGDASRFPTFLQLMQSLENLVAAHPATTFIGAHVGCYAEDLSWVSRMLGSYPNFAVDLGGRLAEIGRQPRAFRRLVVDHPTQVLFGTDAFPVGEDDYATYFRFLETDDEHFPYADADVPPQGRWQISGADLPADVLPGLYAGNARRLLHLD
jgi:predicted TIM-barrel fold metal-dependent hydrolase